MILENFNYITSGCEGDVYVDNAHKRVIKLLYEDFSQENFIYLLNIYRRCQYIHGVIKLVNDIKYKNIHRKHLLFDYIEGHSLAKICVKRSLSLFEALSVMSKIINVIVEVHQEDIVHGDIHAENVMLSNANITLIDFYAFRKQKTDDLVDICKLFYEIKWDVELIPKEVKALFPKRKDAILRRYTTTKDLQNKMRLLFRSFHV